MTPQERAERLLSRLPTLLQGGPNLRRLFEALGTELAKMEGTTRVLLESRWYKLAQGFKENEDLATKASSDLAAIGALFGAHPGLGETSEYFRRHLAEWVRIHATGLTTSRAILELVSFVYLAEQPPHIEVHSTGAIGWYKLRRQNGHLLEARVELIDNPTVAESSKFLGVEANSVVITDNTGLESTFPAVDIKASGGDVVFPLLHHEETGLDVIYVGTIPSGQTLSFRHEAPALLDGKLAKGQVIVANPTRFAKDGKDAHVFHFDTSKAKFAVCKISSQLPAMERGATHWSYRTLTPEELTTYVGHLAKVEPRAPPRGNQAENTESPKVDLTFRWTEIVPAAFELRIPVGIFPEHVRDPLVFYRDIQAALEYGRAAGVRATLGLSLPLPAEIVDIEEKPLATTIDMAFVEEQPTTDGALEAETSIAFRESVDEPQDEFAFGGIFNTTRFNGSKLQ